MSDLGQTFLKKTRRQETKQERKRQNMQRKKGKKERIQTKRSVAMEYTGAPLN